MITKKNDWFATILHQPEANMVDIYENGITPDNTDFKTRDYYKNLPQVVEVFTNDEGKFDEVLFNNKYQSALVQYNDFANEDFEKTILENYDYAAEEWYAPSGSEVKDLSSSFTINKASRQAQGISGLGKKDAATMSVREIAQTNKVVDYETGETLDWSPNDKGGLFKSIFRPTLVIAAWDEDGIHQVNGQDVQHYAGDLKLNVFGEAYYETIGNREIYNKDVLHFTDTVTVDGSKWNKYDLFDSDGVDKSIGGTVMKTVFTVAPMLIPKVGKIFGAISAATALSQTLPTIAKSINGIVSGTNDNDVGKFFTSIENATSRFGSSVSDYSRNNMVSAENLGKLISDVSLQLFQQRVIGSIPKILNSGKVTKENIKLGQNLALTYMAATSSQQAYSEFKNAGASDRVAGLGMLASMGAMYSLMNMNYFKDAMFKGSYLDENVVKTPAKEVIKEVQKSLNVLDENPKQTFSLLSNLFGSKIKNAATKAINSSITNTSTSIGNSLMHRGLNEGIEETMEELSADAIKALFQGADSLGIPMTTSEINLDFGWDATDMMQRYAMSFVGGAIGGPIFDLQTRWENKLNNTIINHNRRGSEELTYLIAQGRGGEIRDYYNWLHQKGKLGNKNLSADKVEAVDTIDGNVDVAFLGATAENKNQNDLVYNVLINHLDYMEKVMSEEGLLLSQAALQKGLVDQLSAKRPDFADVYTQVVAKAGLHNRLLEDFQTLSTDIVSKRAKLEALVGTLETPASTETERQSTAQNVSQNLEVQKLQTELNNLRQKRSAIINGDLNDYYLGQSLFTFDKELQSQFLDLSIEGFATLNYGLNYDQASDIQKQNIKEAHEDYLKETGQNKAFRAFDIYYNTSERFAEKLLEEDKKVENVQQNNLYQGDFLGLRYLKGLQEIKAIDKQLAIINNKTEQTEEDLQTIEELTKKKEALKNYVDDIANAPALTINEIIDQEFAINPNQEGRNEVDILASHAETLLQHFADNNLLGKNTDELDILFDALSQYYEVNEFTLEEQLLGIFSEEQAYKGEIIIGLSSWFPTINNLIREHVNGLKTGHSQEPINKIKEIIKEVSLDSSLDLTDSEIDSITDILLPKINNENLTVFNDRVQTLKGKITYAGYNDILSSLIMDINGEPIRINDLLNNERITLSNQRNLREYVISDPFVENELKKVLEINKVTQAIIIGAGNGMNDKMNALRSNKNPLATISDHTISLLQEDAQLLQNKISTLIAISEGNKQKRLKTHKDVALNMKPKFIRSLIGMGNILEEEINGLFDGKLPSEFNLQTLWENAGNLDINVDITEENFEAYELQIINFEESIYQMIGDLLTTDVSNQDIAEGLTTVFGKELWKMRSTVLSEDSTQEVQMYDLLMYFASIMSSSSNAFYSTLKEVVDTDTYTFAPVYSQELALRSAWAFTLNKEFFGNIVTQIAQTAPHLEGVEIQEKGQYTIDNVNYNGDDLIYLQHKSILKNIFFTFGGAGTGKTTAIGGTLKLMLEKLNAKAIVTAPSTVQTQKFAKSLSIEKDDAYTKEELLKLIRKPDIAWDKAVESNYGHIQRLLAPNLSDADLFNGHQGIKIMFLDEASLFTEAEYQLLEAWAAKNNVTVLALGDLKQNSIKIKNETSGLEDTFHLKSPSLTAALRAANNGKIDNYVILRNAVEIAEAELFNNPVISAGTMSTFVDTNVVKANKLILKYYEKTVDGNTEVRGEKIVNDNIEDILKTVEQLEKLGSVLIVTDSEEKYQNIKTDNITIRNSTVAQGGEYDFVIIDKNWFNDNKGNLFFMLKDLYTLTQRSRIGTVIVDNGITEDLKITNELNKGAWVDFDLPAEEISTFKNDRIKTLSRVPKPDMALITPTEVTVVEDEVQSEQTISVDNKPVETEVVVNNPSSTDIGTNQGEKPEINEQTITQPQPQVMEDEVDTIEDSQSITVTDVNSQPSGVQVSKTKKLTKADTISNEEYIKRYISKQVVVVNYDDVLSYMYSDNSLYKKDKDREHSLRNWLNKDVDEAKYLLLSRHIMDGIMNNHDLKTFKIKLQQVLNNRKITSELLANIDKYEILIKPSEITGVANIMAQFITTKGDIVEFIIGRTAHTGPYGKYTGKFNRFRGTDYVTGNRQFVNNIDTNKVTINPTWVIVGEKRSIIEQKVIDGTYSKDVGGWLGPQSGKTFVFFTHDTLADFNEFMAPTVTNDQQVYAYQKNGNYVSMGVQKMLLFSDIVTHSIAVTQADLEKGMNEVAMAKTGFYKDVTTGVSTLIERAVSISGLNDFDRAKKTDLIPSSRAGKLLTAILNASQSLPTAFSALKKGLFEEIKTSNETQWTDKQGKVFTYKSMLKIQPVGRKYAYIFNFIKNKNTTAWEILKYENGQVKEIVGNLNIKDTSVPIEEMINWVRTAENITSENLFDPTAIELSLITRKGAIGQTVGHRYSPIYTKNMIYTLTKDLPDFKMLDDILEEDIYFKNNVYANDVGGSPLSINPMFRPLLNTQGSYTTDVSTIYAPIYGMDSADIVPETIVTKIDEQKQFEEEKTIRDTQLRTEVIDLLKTANVDNNTINVFANSNLDIEESINWLNTHLHAIMLDTKFPQIINNGNSYKIEWKMDIETFIGNTLENKGIYVKEIKYYDFENLNIIPIFVILKDGVETGFLLMQKGDIWEVSEFKTYNSYSALKFEIRELQKVASEDTIEDLYTLEKYLNATLQDNVSLDIANKYIDIINNNSELLKFDSDVKKYLLERLQNNEC